MNFRYVLSKVNKVTLLTEIYKVTNSPPLVLRALLLDAGLLELSGTTFHEKNSGKSIGQ